MTRRFFRGAGIVGLAGALALAGCGGDDDEGSSAGTAAPAASAATSAAATTAAATTTGGRATTTAARATTTSGGGATTTGAGATTTAAGGAGGGGAACAEAQGATIGYAEPIPDPNFALIEDVMQRELDAVGATLKPVNANLDPGKQISDVKALQQEGIDVLVINPVDPNAVQGVLGEIRSAGIPIVVQDTKVGGPYATNVTADVESAAAEGARALKALVGDGQVAAIIGPPFAEVLVREAQAFAAAAEAEGLNVVETATNQAISPDGAREITNGFKQQYGSELAGIWTFNDTSAVGVASALDGDFDPVLVSINGQPEAIPLVQDGKIDVTFDLQQDMLGRALAFAAVGALCGDTLPADIWVESEVIDSGTVGAWVNPQERGQRDVELALEQRGDKTYIVEV